MSDGHLADLLTNRSGFYNSGYWINANDNLETAQRNLIAKLTERLPKTGKILDVACGEGASIKYLSQYFDQRAIYGIDISEWRIQKCLQVAPDSNLAVMNATTLRFDDDFFDSILCIASAVYFEPREAFFAEACRVLRGKGQLAMYDVIEKALDSPGIKNIAIADLDSYRAALHHAGFRKVHIEDISTHVIGPFRGHLEKFARNHQSTETAQEIAEFQERTLRLMDRWKSYVLVFATK